NCDPKWSLIRRLLLSVLWLVLTPSGSVRAQAQVAAVAGGPLNILIAYRCEPADRPAFRAYLQHDTLARLARLQQQGILRSYQILFNSFVTPNTWDALTILRFTRYSDTQRWKDFERSAPGGLTAAGLRLAKPVATYSADLPWEDEG